MPAAPKPKVVTTVDDAIASASIWYTYCPNDLALEDAEKRGSRRSAFVGVPCQITPVRKIQLADTRFLDNGRKKPQHIERQTKFLKGFGDDRRLHDRAPLHRGVHLRRPHGAEDREEMGIPLADVKKFNVKGKVLVYKKDGEVVEMSLHKAQEYARPECHHCGDFTAELADISCGGVALHGLDDHVLRSSAARSSSTTWCAAASSRSAPWTSSSNR
jgi:coenzyme F420 hydrogenase subunit beta